MNTSIRHLVGFRKTNDGTTYPVFERVTFKLKRNNSKQKYHFSDNPHRNSEGKIDKGYFTAGTQEEIWQMIEDKIGTGYVYKLSNGSYREAIDCNKVIGKHVDNFGNKSDTTKMVIIYSKNDGYHAYPSSQETATEYVK